MAADNLPEVCYSIGYWIKRYRRQRGLTQRKLAATAGVNVKRIEEWERGTSIPRVDNVARLAKALDIKMEQLVPL